MHIDEIVASVYNSLMEPPETVVPLNLVLRVGREEDQMLGRDVMLSGNFWQVGETRLMADSASDSYTVPIASNQIGRVILVESLTSTNTRRRVRIADRKDQESVTSTQIPTSNLLLMNFARSPEEIAFYKDLAGVIRCRISPWPSDPTTYIITYTPGETRSFQSLNQTPNSLFALPQFWDLLASRMVWRLARHCMHLPPQERDTIYKQESERLFNPLHGLMRQWNDARRQDTTETDGFADGAGLGDRGSRWGF